VRARLAPLRAEVAALEQRLGALAARRTQLEQELGDAGVYADQGRARLDALLGEQASTAQAIEQCESRWLAALERLEAAAAASATRNEP